MIGFLCVLQNVDIPNECVYKLSYGDSRDATREVYVLTSTYDTFVHQPATEISDLQILSV